MQFKNTTGKEKLVRMGSNKFVTVKPGEIVDVSAYTGDFLGFKQVREGVEIKSEDEPASESKDHDGKPANEPESQDEYKERLLAIERVGPKTMRDIIHVYPTEEDLKLGLISGDETPFRDDIGNKLKEEFLG